MCVIQSSGLRNSVKLVIFYAVLLASKKETFCCGIFPI